MASSWKNRLSNLISTPTRVIGSAVYTGIDFLKTWVALGKDAKQISMNTLDDIKGLFQEAGKRWHMWHKAVNVPVLAPVWSVGKVGEGSVRLVVNTAVNWIKNIFSTGKGLAQNLWNSGAKVFSKEPISTFQFKHISLANIWKNFDFNKMLIGSAAGWTAVASVKKEASESQSSAPNKSDWDTKTKKTLSDMTAKMQAQEKTNKELEKSVLSVKEQMEKQTKLMEQQLDQKDKIIASLQDTNNKSKPKDDANQESSKKKSFEKEANNLKDHIDTLVPEWYKTRIDTPGWHQRIVISDSKKKEKKHKPEFYLTFLDANTVKLNYSPYDRVNDQREAANYVGYFSFDDDKLKDCVKTISFAMKDWKNPSSIDKHLQEKYSLKKSVNKDTIDEHLFEENPDYIHESK